MNSLKNLIRPFIPQRLLSLYHLALAILALLWYRFPSRKLTVIGITGTKGKSTTSELVHAILEGAGHRTALLSTIRFATPAGSSPNLFKMTMPGRFFVQRFLRQALRDGATHAAIEITSEGAAQWRHFGIELDALIFTNLAPEHIESHGSFENYVAAKLSLARLLQKSPKARRIIVSNIDDTYGKKFLETRVEVRAPFSLKDAEPYTVDDRECRFMWRGELYTLHLPGRFNLYNALAALTLGEALALSPSAMKKALEEVQSVPGRAERVSRGQDFTVVVDYAHTLESLQALYDTFPSPRICVLGNTGGGRDRGKRPLMGALADSYCSLSLLTDEDPYDENPRAILDDMAKGFTKTKPHIVLNRREAIREALRTAKTGSSVLITGKGTDPYIMGARGSKIPWSDKHVVEEELEALLEQKGSGAYH